MRTGRLECLGGWLSGANWGICARGGWQARSAGGGRTSGWIGDYSRRAVWTQSRAIGSKCRRLFAREGRPQDSRTGLQRRARSTTTALRKEIDQEEFSTNEATVARK